MVKVLQCNMHRSRTADYLLAQIMRQCRADVVLISEQYKQKTGEAWFGDLSGTAAVWVPAFASVRKFGAGNGYSWVLINNTYFVSVYLTPNESVAAFDLKLQNLEDTIRTLGSRVVIGGDLNAKAEEWGMPKTDRRGTKILEMAARCGLVVANQGNTATFRRPGCAHTIPDVTLVAETVGRQLQNWRVTEEYTGSDHQYITYDISAANWKPEPIRSSGWNLSKLNNEKLLAAVSSRSATIRRIPENSATELVDRTMEILERACSESMPRRQPHRRAGVYWWNDEIAELRRECLKHRRRATRRRGRNLPTTQESTEYKIAKKRLKNAIRTSIKNRWDALTEDVNRDPWGLGFKIVMKRLAKGRPEIPMPAEHVCGIVEELFPSHPILEENLPTPNEPIDPFSERELAAAVKLLKNKKAPGPDGIPAEVLKLVAGNFPSFLLTMYNACLMEGTFPNRWKVQRLVLIPKGKGDPCAASAYRPLCMLDTAGKLLERMLLTRLQTITEGPSGLSSGQHGFRRGRSTLTAISELIAIYDSAQARNHCSRPIVALVALDVRNAFNSVKWSEINTALKIRFNIPTYLLRMIASYLKNRKLLFQTSGRTHEKVLTAGAAQGSILGPTLWNVAYDGIFSIPDLPDGATLIGYADDVAAVITGRTETEIQYTLNQVMRRVSSWLSEHGLSLAIEKTEVVLLTRRRMPLQVPLLVGGQTIITAPAVKYLGLQIDCRMRFKNHLEAVCAKAARVTTSLSKLMINVGGPSASRRRLLMSVVESVLLYGAEIWTGRVRKSSLGGMRAVQRRMALRICSAYRTVSGPAALVIAGVTPIELLASERKRLFEAGAEKNKANERTRTLEHWQAQWETEGRGRWTARMIADVRPWIQRRHGEVNYYLTQLLSGHGYFFQFLHKIGKVATSECPYGDAEADTACHTFFECQRWQQQREELTQNIGYVEPETLATVMLHSQTNWSSVENFARTILKKKHTETLDRREREPEG